MTDTVQNKFKSIQFKNSNFRKTNKHNDTIINFDNINFHLKNKKQTFSASGNFLSDKIPTSFEIIVDTNKNNDSSIKIESPILKLKI